MVNFINDVDKYINIKNLKFVKVNRIKKANKETVMPVDIIEYQVLLQLENLSVTIAIDNFTELSAAHRFIQDMLSRNDSVLSLSEYVEYAKNKELHIL